MPKNTVPVHTALSLMISYYPCIIISLLPVPSAPRDLNLESVSTDATLLMASWTRPMPANGVIATYTLYCTGVEEQFYEDQIVPGQFFSSLGGNVLSTTLENLLPFTIYECYITANTSAGEGDESSPVMKRTNETCTFTSLVPRLPFICEQLLRVVTFEPWFKGHHLVQRSLLAIIVQRGAWG